MYKLDNVIALKAGVKAQTVRVNGMACLVRNNSASAEVYLKERREDGADVTAENGWVLAPGTETAVPFAALELSVAAAAENADVRVLILDEL